jgi:hypothetical protein
LEKRRGYWTRVIPRAFNQAFTLVFGSHKKLAMHALGLLLAWYGLKRVGQAQIANEHLPWELSLLIVEGGFFALVFILKLFTVPAEMDREAADREAALAAQIIRPKTVEEKFAEMHEVFDGLDNWMHDLLANLLMRREEHEGEGSRWLRDMYHIDKKKPFAELQQRTGWLQCREQNTLEWYSIATKFKADVRKMLHG